jgi:hypothetical protein
MPEARKTPVSWRFAGLWPVRPYRATAEALVFHDPLIELELRGGLRQWIGTALPGRFPQRRSTRRGKARWSEWFAQVLQDLPDGIASVDEGNDPTPGISPYRPGPLAEDVLRCHGLGAG